MTEGESVTTLFAREAGWTDDQISEQKTFTDGKIVVLENKCGARGL